MAEESPTLMVLYDLGSSERQRVAEFRLAATGCATLTVIEPAGCPLAEEWFDRGVEILHTAQYVMPDDGRAFMRALLQPFGMSYYRLVDESSGESGNPVTPSPWAGARKQRPDEAVPETT
ncbi:hypothetical protein ACLMAJ_32450 [Nocardia sp. KC 131]|uniref:hypothetical protein n=1 Tax=Nocardia arseniciresistens TaxID=3392119 RepID=UPI00398E689E